MKNLVLASLAVAAATQTVAAAPVTGNVSFKVYSYYGLENPNIGSCEFQYDSSTVTELEYDCDGTGAIVVGDITSLSCSLIHNDKDTVFGIDNLPGNTWYASRGESAQVANKDNRGPVESGSDDRFQRGWKIGGETVSSDYLFMEFKNFRNEKTGQFTFDNHNGAALLGSFLIDIDAPDPEEDDHFAPATCPSTPVVRTIGATNDSSTGGNNPEGQGGGSENETTNAPETTSGNSNNSSQGSGGGGSTGLFLLALSGLGIIRRKLRI